ncbi:LPXTG cell wall anchor domain-containing protein, partial [Bacillus subtilis]|uniref:LPXTG cell wall anchor domain-containing protein n=1 Tax=Bacillus subtilis TaxID=1423 RepID=UPI002DB9D5AC
DNDSNTGSTKPSTGSDKVENNTVKNSNHTQTDSDQKAKKYSGDKLPKTGDSDSIYTMPIIGTILLLVAGAAAYINRKFIFGNK